MSGPYQRRNLSNCGSGRLQVANNYGVQKASSQYDISSSFLPFCHLSSYHQFVNILCFVKCDKKRRDESRRDTGRDPGCNPASVGVCLTNEIVSNMHCRTTHL